MFPELQGLTRTYADDETTIVRVSQVLKIAVVRNQVFKLDGNLDFNMGKTKFLAKSPMHRHVYERDQYFLQTDPDLQVIVHDFTPITRIQCAVKQSSRKEGEEKEKRT